MGYIQDTRLKYIPISNALVILMLGSGFRYFTHQHNNSFKANLHVILFVTISASSQMSEAVQEMTLDGQVTS